MDTARVVEIYASQAAERSYGSGYLIAAGLVLTARHVVAPALASGADRGTCELRLIGDVAAGRLDWREFDIAWEDAALDLALLRARPASGASDACTGPDPAPALVSMALLPRTEVQPACRAIGFPRVLRQDERNQTQEVSGVVLTGSMLAARLWQVAITTGVAPRDDADWKGVSGAALFCADQLVGVITDAESRFRQGVLVAQPIDPLADDAGFMQALGLTRDAAFEPYRGVRHAALSDPKPWAALGRLIYLVDRKIPVAELKTAVVRTLTAPTAPRTFACAVPGNVEHEHIDLIELFRRQTWPALFAGRPGFDAILTMDWATQAISVAHGLQLLRSQVHEMLGILDAGPRDSARRIAGALNGNVTPRAFCWEIRESAFTPLQRELLIAWLAEWGEVAGSGLNDIVALFFCLVFDAPALPAKPSPRWQFWTRLTFWRPGPKPLASLRGFASEHFDLLDAVRDRDRLRRVRLSDLAPCERPQHLRDWGVQLEARPRDRWLAEHVVTLETEFKQDKFSLRDLRAKLSECSQAAKPRS